MMNGHTVAIGITLVAGLAGGCSPAGLEGPGKDTDVTDTGSSDLVPKVLMVMIDGFIPDVIDLTDTPAMDRLLPDSAWSMEARAESTTISGSGWSTFVTGVHWDKHGAEDNEFSDTHYEDYPHIFALVHEALPDATVAGCQCWEPIEEGLVVPSDPDIHSYYNYDDYSDDYFDEASPDRFCGEDVADWAATADADLYVIMFADTDGVGHAWGYGAEYPHYQAEITEVDGFILDILEAIESFRIEPGSLQHLYQEGQ
ncbi:MAG: alkaline phosphatase family protein [Myxococcota bacterium]|nr:alkaline phosphatase family protein [Myxococcota bacterium]